jgi:hypothetical protein
MRHKRVTKTHANRELHVDVMTVRLIIILVGSPTWRVGSTVAAYDIVQTRGDLADTRISYTCMTMHLSATKS